NDHRFRHTLHTRRFEAFVLFIQTLREQGNPSDPSMVEVCIGGAFCGWLFPLDQVKARRSWIVTQRQQCSTGDTIGNAEPNIIARIGPLTDVEDDLKPQVFVERERTVKIFYVDVNVKDGLNHGAIPSL